MDLLLFKTILGRFRKVDYEYLSTKWGPLVKGRPLENIDLQKVSKLEFADAVLNKFKRKISSELVADLDLFYQQKYPNKKVWKVYKVERIPGASNNQTPDVRRYQKKLRKDILLHHEAEVHTAEYLGMYWTRVAIETDGTRQRMPSSTYLVHIPHTQYVFTAGLKKTNSHTLWTPVMTMLNGHDVSDIYLSGHHLTSLVRMVLTKHAQGQEVNFPGIERVTQEEDLPHNVLNENRVEKRQREIFLEDNFGPLKQPKLEKVEYKLETKFKSNSVPSLIDKDQIFHCRVKFEGPNVLEGIRNLADAGIATLPFKAHVGKVHTMARNMFVLKQTS